MSVFPVIVRELKAQARQPLTHWLRVIGGLAIAAAIAATFLESGVRKGWTGGALAGSNPFQTFGTTLFGKMNLLIFVAIWVFVPLATADAISRERREGTLSLLYLTELRSLGIVVGKAFVHALRAVSLFLTMAPWLMLPLLFGGVGLRDIGMALMIDSASLLLAQAAGLLATTIPRDWLKSVILAEVFALVLLLGLLHVHGDVVRTAVTIGTAAPTTPGLPRFWDSPFQDLFGYNHSGLIWQTRLLIEYATNGSFGPRQDWYGGFYSGQESNWQLLWTHLTPVGHHVWFAGVARLLIGSALVLLAATWVGARRVEKSWQDAPPQAYVAELRRRFLSPRFRVLSHTRGLSRSLTSNPIGWLQIYSPSARLVKWIWCLFIMAVEILFSANSADLYAAQSGLAFLLLLGLAFSATGSFREELETGAFELLLVTPLGERQIIGGRVRGLWSQFLPAILVYGTGSIYLASGWADRDSANEAWLALARTMMSFCTLPLVGLWFSVQRWNFFAAWLAACLVGLMPAAVVRTFGAPELPAILLQFAVAFVAAGLLLNKLKNRQFLQRRSD